jgi:hypothetical protein
MEIRMQPRSEWNQRCFTFDLLPFAQGEGPSSYRDHLGNLVHHFDIAGAPFARCGSPPLSGRGGSPPRPLPEAVAEETW